MNRCKAYKCNALLWEHSEHHCLPLWDIMDIDGFIAFGEKERYWSHVRGVDAKDVAQTFSRDDCDFYKGYMDFIVRDTKTKELVKVSVTAEPTIDYNAEIDEEWQSEL